MYKHCVCMLHSHNIVSSQPSSSEPMNTCVADVFFRTSTTMFMFTISLSRSSPLFRHKYCYYSHFYFITWSAPIVFFSLFLFSSTAPLYWYRGLIYCLLVNIFFFLFVCKQLDRTFRFDSFKTRAITRVNRTPESLTNWLVQNEDLRFLFRLKKNGSFCAITIFIRFFPLQMSRE